MANTFIKCERIIHLMHLYRDSATDTERELIDSLVTMYVYEWSSVSVYPSNFTDDIEPYQLIEIVQLLNEAMNFKFKYTLRTDDKQEWHMRISLISSELHDLLDIED